MKWSRVSLSCVVVFAACSDEAEVVPPSTPEVATVKTFEPQGETATRPIELWFDRPVVADAQVGRKNAGPAPLAIEPAVPGYWEWRAVDHLAYVPSEPFRASTNYEVQVLPKALSTPLGASTSYRFNTELFTLTAIEPFFGDDGSVRVNVVFTHAVKPNRVGEGTRFESSTGRALRATLETTEPGRVMAFALVDRPTAEEGTEIKVRVAGTLTAAVGGDPIGKEIVRTLAVEGAAALKVHDVSPSESGGRFTLWVRFSAQVDPAALVKVLRIDPPVKTHAVDGYYAVGLEGPFTPSTSYKIIIPRGLRGRNGVVLDAPVNRTIVFPDLSPSVRFSDGGNYLMKRGRQTLGVETVNVQRLTVSVDEVASNNLAHVIPRLAAAGACSGEWCGQERYNTESESYYWRWDLGTLGRNVFRGAVDVEGKRNQISTTHVPFDDVDVGDRRGVYRVRIYDETRGWIAAEKWLLATDLGITAKVGPSEIRANVVSLRTLKPVENVEVSFISRTNQHLGRATTNASGVAVMRYSARPKDPVSLLTAKRGKDFSYLALAGTALSTDDFDVGGASGSGTAYDAYIFSDRGVYRPGDRARLGVVVRTSSLRSPGVFPYSLEVRDPRWRVFSVSRLSTDKDGVRELTIDIPPDAPTGKYVVRALVAGQSAAMGRHELRVEAFMPDRLKVDVAARDSAPSLSAPVLFDVTSAYLFGPPAAGLAVSKQCRFREVPIVSQQFRSFPIAVPSENRGTRLDRVVAAGEGTLDDGGRGEASCAIELPEAPQRPVQVELRASVAERGGRAVTGMASVIAHAREHYVGVRRNGKTEYAEAGKDSALEVLVVDETGASRSGVPVTATFRRLQWKSILKLVSGRYRYVSQLSASEAGTAEVTSSAGVTALPFVAKSPGRYDVEVRTESGATSTAQFWVAGSGWNAWEMNKPDQVGLTLDREVYNVGGTANLMVRSPFEGRVYISIERDRVLWSRSFDLEGNTGTVALPVTDAMLPNAYVVVQVVRSARSVEKAAPLRAFGVVPLAVASDRHRLTVKIKSEDDIRPRSTLDVLLKVEGARGKARVLVAAVDEGILRITGHRSPDPLAHFSRKRRLDVRTHDLFDRVLPELEGRASSIVRTSGGDAAVRAKHLASVGVKRVEPVALWSGVVETSAEGWARAKLDVPQFAGQLRLMVVAIQGDRFGAADKPVTVADPIVLMPTLPRFVGPLDKFRVPVEVRNRMSQTASIQVALDAGGRLAVSGEASKSIELAAGAAAVVEFDVSADEVAGEAKITITASGGGERTSAVTNLMVRPASTAVSTGFTAAVRHNEPASYRIPRGYVPGTLTTRISVGGLPASSFGSSLQYLLRYPHGCAEQTTSRAFPLIYLGALAKAAAGDIVPSDGVDPLIDAAVHRLFSMQTADGALAYWPGGDRGYPWTSAYGAHFLVEAKRAGYAVDRANLSRLLDHLTRIARGAALTPYRNQEADIRSKAYALYVLSLAERPLSAELHHLSKDLAKVDAETRALVDGALLLAGDRRRATAFIGMQLPAVATGPTVGFASPTRVDALMLSVIADVDPSHRSVPELVKRVQASAKGGRWGNTQENAFALLALGKIGKRLGGKEFWGTVRVSGNEKKKFNRDRRGVVVHEGDDWAGETVDVTVTGMGTAFIGVEVTGVPAGLPEAASNGLDVSRTFHDREGAPVDPASLKHGDMIVVKVNVAAPLARVENVAVVDLLAAGLEVENPRLADDAVLPWMKDRTQPDYLDIRDDRLIFFASIDAKASATFYYYARAVTSGDFILPHVFAEAMYDPTVNARAGGGRVQVAAH